MEIDYEVAYNLLLIVNKELQQNNNQLRAENNTFIKTIRDVINKLHDKHLGDLIDDEIEILQKSLEEEYDD